MLKNLFGMGTPTDFAQLVAEGATIIDVRSPGEYSGGHIKGSSYYPATLATASLMISKGFEPFLIAVSTTDLMMQ